SLEQRVRERRDAVLRQRSDVLIRELGDFRGLGHFGVHDDLQEGVRPLFRTVNRRAAGGKKSPAAATQGSSAICGFRATEPAVSAPPFRSCSLLHGSRAGPSKRHPKSARTTDTTITKLAASRKHEPTAPGTTFPCRTTRDARRFRSEERRVGKECRSRWSRAHAENK